MKILKEFFSYICNLKNEKNIILNQYAYVRNRNRSYHPKMGVLNLFQLNIPNFSIHFFWEIYLFKIHLKICEGNFRIKQIKLDESLFFHTNLFYVDFETQIRHIYCLQRHVTRCEDKWIYSFSWWFWRFKCVDDSEMIHFVLK